MRLFDSHCHLHFPQYDADRAEVLARMQEKDMGAVLIGTDLETSRAALALAKQHDFLWASVGLHPNDKIDEVFDAEAFEALASDPKVVAIGECGLDYFRSGKTPEEKKKQEARFRAHIALAQEMGKALIVHCRDAHEDCIAILKDVKPTIPVVMHFFTVSGDVAQQYAELGCYLSFPGPITFTDMYDESIRIAPLERILIETDAPYAAPAPHRGKRNEPVYVEEVAKKIAAIKGIPMEEVARQTVLNAQGIFGLAK